MPDAFEDAGDASPWAEIRLADVHSMVIGGMTFEPEAAQAGMHFAMETARLAKVMHDIVQAGFDATHLLSYI